ncbi:MAG: 7-cyano-7-deazaguanine synthase QueC [Planctomycetaceae bacterium]|nr:7-cyano-7-deazaguanine synthase QueC [Planctomycetaceae bacterium]
MKRAVVLLSGGLDSAAVLAWMRREGFACHALSFRYGQRHGVELARAAEMARALGAVEHKVAEIDLRAFGGSALTADIAVPKDRADGEIAHGVPITYVPARNTIFLAFALAYAETLGSSDIAIGVNAIDYSGYPDCRPEFIEAFERLANLATKAGAQDGARFRIHTPLQRLSKAEIVRLAVELGVPVGRTLSCYDPSADGTPCGHCDACILRRKGFAEAGMRDGA